MSQNEHHSPGPQPPPDLPPLHGGEIAILGMAGRFPRSPDLETFWRRLAAGEDCITYYRDEELLAAGIPAERLAKPTYVKAQSWLEDTDLFDAEMFGFTRREAEITSPQMRIFLETVWQALENAGCDPQGLSQGVGVFASASSDAYIYNLYSDPELRRRMGLFRLQIGNEKEFLPAWISYKLNLKGPAVNVQTACSSSLVAVHMACQSLLSAECELAVAGGVSVRDLRRYGYFFVEGGIFSADGHCRSFDARADGTVNGDGAGAVILKRLEDALADGDPIRAIIRGSAINNDGWAKVGFTAPSIEGQNRVISEALAVAEVDPRSVGYVETHGTGTRIGDPIEVSALRDAFSAYTEDRGFCALGAVKASIGHLDAAAGVAGLIKAVLALEHRQIPPLPNFESPNPEIDFAASPFFVPTELTEWPPSEGTRRAEVSAFGIGGTNAHLVLEQAPPSVTGPDASGPSRAAQLLVLAARDPAALEQMSRALAEHLRRQAQQIESPESAHRALADAAFTLQRGRTPFEHRRAVVAHSLDQAADGLDAPATPGPGLPRSNERGRPVAFLLPGQGAQRPRLGAELYHREAVFRRHVDRCAEILAPHLDGDLREVLGWQGAGAKDPDEAARRLRQTAWAQPALVVTSLALAELWKSWGVVPGALLGHSLGELSAAILAGVLELEPALEAVALRGRWMQEQPPGAMLAVPLEPEAISLSGSLAIAAINAPGRTVVTGPTDEIDGLARRFEEAGTPGRRLQTSHAFHSTLMEPVAERLAAHLAKLDLQAPATPFLSNVSGVWITPEEATDPGYWSRQMLSPVRFSAAAETLLGQEPWAFVEVGPGASLGSLVRRQGDFGEAHLAVSSLAPPVKGIGEDTREDTEEGEETRGLLDALGRLWTSGVPVDWQGLSADETRRRVALPTYPFQRQRYWIANAAIGLGGDPAEESQDNPEETPEEELAMAELSPERTPLAAVTPEPPSWRVRVLDAVKDVVHELTGAEVADIDEHVTFLEVGVDSLLLIQASQRIEDRFGVKLPLIQLLEELTTLDNVAGHLEAELGEARLAELLSPLPEPVAQELIVPEPVTSAAPDTAEPAAAAPEPQQVPAASEPPPPASLPSPAATPPPPQAGPPAPTSGTPAALPVPAGTVEGLIAQQLQFLAQQLAALQGQAAAPAPAGAPTAPVAAAGPAPIPAAAPSPSPSPSPSHLPSPSAPVDKPDEHPVSRAAGAYRPAAAAAAAGFDAEQKKYLASFIESYNRRTAKSKEAAQKNRPALADGRSSVGFKRLTKELVYPIHGSRSAGSKIWDLDGNEYVDIAMGFGLHYFGHSPAFVMEALERQLATGIEIGPQSPLAGEAARLVCELSGMDRAVFCNSGTEAVMGALRVARTYTRRNKIALLSDSYHGWFDGTLGRTQVIDGKDVTVPLAPGVPPSSLGDVLIVPYGEPAGLELLERHMDELAAVLVEPVRSRTPWVQPGEFLRSLQKLTDPAETVLIFDEMVTGFRVHPGGAAAHFGVEPDLATYGKLLAAGLPIGVVAGRGRYMDIFDGGMWSYGDASYPTSEKTMFAGAFFKHPLTMAATLAVLGRMKAEGPELHRRLNERTDALVADLNQIFADAGVPMEAANFGPLFRFRVPRELHPDIFFYHLVANGIYYSVEVGNCFLSTAHTDEDLERIKDGVRRSLRQMQAVGLLPGESPPEDPPRRSVTFTEPSPSASAAVSAAEPGASAGPRPVAAGVDLGIYFFGNYEAEYHQQKYRLLLEGARFADRNGFSSIWLPERHFDAFGGFSPNPSVLAAALARETEQLSLRAGSVVVPLHQPIRVAEEWSMVDNLSDGRVGLSFASGWHANDFVFAPDNYRRRREVMYRGIEEVRALWRGEAVSRRDGNGQALEVKLFPMPKQAELPIWLTAASPETYLKAGELGAGILTNLQTQSLEDLERHLGLYFEALERHGHDPSAARVTLLQHTFVGEDTEATEAHTKGPLLAYLRSSFRLVQKLVQGQGRDIDFDKLSPEDLDYMIESAYRRYVQDHALIGSVETCVAQVERVRRLGVTEIGCLLDFGLEDQEVLQGLEGLSEVRAKVAASGDGSRESRAEPVRETFEVSPEAPPLSTPLSAPLTEAQRSLWLECQMETDANRAYNEPMTLRLKGPLDLKAMSRALAEVVERHAMLRASVDPEGSHWRIAKSLEISIPVEDLSDLPKDQRETRGRQWLQEQAGNAFDLEAGPLFRCGVAKLGEDDHYFDLSMHHLIIDGHSGAVMMQELIRLYSAYAQGEAPPELGTVRRFEDYVEAKAPQLGDLKEAESYWLDLFAGGMPALELPTDRPRPPVVRYAGDRVDVQLDPALAPALRKLGAGLGATPFMVGLAAWGALLHRLAGQEDLVVGLPMRDPSATGAMVGYFLTLTPICMLLEGDEGFGPYLQKVRRRVVEAQSHPFPLSRLVEHLNPARDQGQAMIAVHFNWETGGRAPRILDLETELVSVHPGVSRFDLQLSILEGPGFLAAQCDFRSHLFDRTTVQRWLRQLEHLLHQVTEHPERALATTPVLPASHRHQMVTEWNDTRVAHPWIGGLHRHFEVQVERTPEAVAVSDRGESFTYRQLNERANRMARQLAALGVGAEVLVAILAERSVDFLTAMLALFKCGGAYLPLDPLHPSERMAGVIQRSGAPLVLVDEDLKEALGEALGKLSKGERPRTRGLEALVRRKGGRSNLEHDGGPKDLAYVLYTSGSTGVPKGASIEQSGMLNHLHAKIHDLGLGAEDVVAQNGSQTFDVSVWQFLAALMVGGRVHIFPLPSTLDPALLIDEVVAAEVSILEVVPSMLRAMIETDLSRGRAGEALGGLRWMVPTGEALPPDLARSWFEVYPRVPVINAFGPTECSDDTNHEVVTEGPPEDQATVPIGGPVNNTQVYVADASMRIVPIGVDGEILIGGAGVGRGYLSDPGRTAELFVPDPFVEDPALAGARLYRSRDLGRFQSDGRQLFLGRLDHQVKVRGFRIELGEIESVLRRHRSVEQTVVLGRELRPGDHRLIAYVVFDAGRAVATEELEDLVRSRLPEYMIPSTFVVLDEMPLNRNGKIDRKALPEPKPEALGAGDDGGPPKNPTEAVLAGIWQEVLDLPELRRRQSFFTLGGHSLLATQVVSRVRRVFGVELPLRAVFEHPTVASLGAQVDAGRRAAAEQPEAEALRRRPADAVPSQSLPLSFAQQRLWFLEHLDPGGHLYNLPMAFYLDGPVDLEALERSVSEVVRRHEVLRTTFAAVAGEARQVIAEATPWKIPVDDLSGEEDPISAALARVHQEFRRPFDLERGPLLRLRLLKLEPQRHLGVVNMHHIASDGWSLPVFLRELTLLYEAFLDGRSSPLEELPIQYADYALWQRRALAGEVLDAQIAYWRETLDGAPALLELPTDRPRPPAKTFGARLVRRELPAELVARLEALGRGRGITLFMTLLAGLQWVLGRWAGTDDVVVGTPIAGRNRVELEDLIGFFVNTLVLRSHFKGGTSVAEALAQVREGTLGAFANQDVPFERLVEELRPERNLSHTPLFQTLFVMQEGLGRAARPPAVELGELALRPFDPGAQRVARFDLTLLVEPAAQGLVLELELNEDLWDEVTGERLLGQLGHLLGALADLGSEHGLEVPLAALPLVDAAEKTQLLAAWDGATAPTVPPLFLEAFLAQARAYGDEPALVFDGETMSYGELATRAAILSRALSSASIGPEAIVGVCLPPSPAMVVALLGILGAGAAYLPLDPAYPAERLALMLADSGARRLLTTDQTAEDLLAALGNEDLADGLVVDVSWLAALEAAYQGSELEAGFSGTPDAANAAYIIYTSGSTGVPKAVVVTHGALADFSAAMADTLALGPGDRMLQFASLSFDASVVQIFPPLARGAAVVLHENPGGLASSELLRLCAREGITILDLPAALWRQWVSDLEAAGRSVAAPVRFYLTGGESVPAAHLRRWARVVGGDPGTRFLSSYGPTEATVTTTAFVTTAAQAGDLELAEVPLGEPLGASRVLLLGRDLEPAPVGVPGEIWIGGAGLARGYHRRPGATAASFVPDPWSQESGARLYRTGDLARHQAGGSLAFLGRRDHQVKVRGYRVELAEVEAALGRYPGVQEAVVVARRDAAGSHLAAYLVPEAGESRGQGPILDLGSVADSLRQVLPEHMVPTHWAELEELPVKASGKVDRAALPEPKAGPQATGPETLEAPRNNLELALVGLWEELLDNGPVGIRDNFFEAGGHSLLSVRLLAQIEQRFGQELPLATFFADPTVEGLARHLGATTATAGNGALVAIQPEGELPPFFCVHPIGGQVLGYYHLARRLAQEVSFYGLQAPALSQPEGQAVGDQGSIEEMASAYLKEVLESHREGPYLLGGASFGGVVAYEMAHQLQEAGREVPLVALIDTPAPEGDVELPNYDSAGIIANLGREQARQAGKELDLTVADLEGLSRDEQLRRVLDGLSELGVLSGEIDVDWLRRFLDRHRLRMEALERYRPRPYPGGLLQIRSEERDPRHLETLTDAERRRFLDPTFGWGDLAADGVEVLTSPGFHETMTDEPHVATLARHLAERIRRAVLVPTP